MASISDYKRCAKMIREEIRAAYGEGPRSAWWILVPDLRMCVVRSSILRVLHGWADAKRGSTVSEDDFEGLIKAVLAEFGVELE